MTIQFFGEADNGLNGVNVSWEAPDTSKAGSGTVPDFKTTEEQLAGIVPYIVYDWNTTDPEQRTGVTGFTWRFVYSNDVDTAVTADEDMTISIRHSGEELGGHYAPYLLSGDGDVERNGLPPITIKKGEKLEGKVELIEPSYPGRTILRYYTGDNKEECYQWHFIWNWGGGVQPLEVRVLYDIRVPLIDGQPGYKYARYNYTNITTGATNVIVEPKYYGIGKLEIEDGDYVLVNNDIEMSGKDIPLISTSLLGNNAEYQPMTREIYRAMGFDYTGQRLIYVRDATGSALSGKKVKWTFPEEISALNGERTMPDFKSLDEQFSSEGFFPYIEFVSEDNYITAIKYRFVQSPDIETPYKPDMFCVMGFEQNFKAPEGEVNYYEYGGIYRTLETTKASYEGDTWTLPKPISLDALEGLGVWICVYPDIQTWDEYYDLWLNNKALLPENHIDYTWLFDPHMPVARLSLIGDEELESISGDISGALGEDFGEIFAVQREEVGEDSEATDDVKDLIESGDTELVGRFKQLNITESGTYAVKVTLPDELYDELEGAASADLAVYPITYSDVGESGGSSTMSIMASSIFSAEANDRPVTGSLLASDGKTFNTVDTKDFILTAYLKKADGDNYTNYSLYLALGTDNPAASNGPKDNNNQDASTTGDIDLTAQEIDSSIKTKITGLINNSEYEVKTLEDVRESITAYAKTPQPNTRILNEISGNFENFAQAGTLPAFTLDVEKPVILILKVTADSANNLPLHFFKMEGSEVAGSILKYVKFSSSPDTAEDKNAVFYDEAGNKTNTLSSRIIYVSAVFENGSYAPLAATGTKKIDTVNSGPNSSSSGCNSGLMGIATLVLLMIHLKKSR